MLLRASAMFLTTRQRDVTYTTVPRCYLQRASALLLTHLTRLQMALSGHHSQANSFDHFLHTKMPNQMACFEKINVLLICCQQTAICSMQMVLSELFPKISLINTSCQGKVKWNKKYYRVLICNFSSFVFISNQINCRIQALLS